MRKQHGFEGDVPHSGHLGESEQTVTVQHDINYDAMRRAVSPSRSTLPQPLKGNYTSGNQWSADCQAEKKVSTKCVHQSSVPPSKGSSTRKGQIAGFEKAAAAVKSPTDGCIHVPICLLKDKEQLQHLIEEFGQHTGEIGSESDDAALSEEVFPPYQETRSSPLELKALKCVTAPVTRESLKELELCAIQNNLALRIDLCFDHELFFQKISGVKGEEKVLKAKLFYECLSIELQTYAHAIRGQCSACELVRPGPTSEQKPMVLPCRLESYLSALRDLVEMLVPENEKVDVVRRLDASWLAAQVRIGQFDACSFSGWLSKLLMSHCAPIRDEMCRLMHTKISEGAKSDNMALLVDGLETLLNLLENMKLDVANHQVRSFKYLLIADTLPFLKDCFTKMIDSDQINVTRSRRWFHKLRNTRFAADETGFCRLLCGLIELCSSPTEPLPRTLSYDKDRLHALRSDILDLVQLTICRESYCNLFKENQGRYPSPLELSSFSGQILQLMHTDGINEGVSCHLEEISIELAKAAVDVSRNAGALGTSLAGHILDPDDIYISLSERLDSLHDRTMQRIMHQVAERVYEHSLRFHKMDTLQISNEQRIWTNDRSAKGFPLAPEIDDIARRLAHIAVIHWEVWRDLVYLKE